MQVSGFTVGESVLELNRELADTRAEAVQQASAARRAAQDAATAHESTALLTAQVRTPYTARSCGTGRRHRTRVHRTAHGAGADTAHPTLLVLSRRKPSKMGTNCTARSLIPTVAGNTVRGFYYARTTVRSPRKLNHSPHARRRSN
jgi:hypothetical protein